MLDCDTGYFKYTLRVFAKDLLISALFITSFFAGRNVFAVYSNCKKCVIMQVFFLVFTRLDVSYDYALKI